MTESTDSLRLRVDAPVATIVLDRPNRHNALNRKLIRSLIQTLEDFHSQGSIRAVVLTGEGSTFCSGTDLHELGASMDSPDAFQQWHEDTQALLELFESMLRFPKPIIAGVNGPVVGSGVALMLASDFVVASDQATVRLPESVRGLSTGVTSPLLCFRVGTSTAARLMMTASTLNSEQAVGLGLFHETVPPDFVWARSFELGNLCAEGARESHQMTKQMLNETIGESLMTQLAIGAANMAAARTTEAAKEGVRAFLEKRAPKW